MTYNFFKPFLVTVISIIFIAAGVQAQDAVNNSEEGYQFTMKKELGTSTVKNQANTGTCWSFSTASFLESELLRLGKEEVDLSEMYIVRYIYVQKALNYVRRQGKANFGQGSMAHDVFNIMGEHGLMPESAYNGRPSGEEKHNHTEMEALLKGIVDAVVAQSANIVSDNWLKAYKAVLDIYLGEVPKSFEYNKKKYTPESFTAKALELNPADYVQITSFSHHPFYKPFVLEVPDNFSNGLFYNVPIEELQATADNALAEGYTIAWDSDVSEKGFSASKGLAILPADGWESKSREDREAAFKKPGEEMEVNQEMRQVSFDNFTTTDDHLMHINGIAFDQNGTKYYKVKNSWGEIGPYDGYLYASESYFKYKTIAIIVHKDAIPADIAKKLGFR